MRIVSLCLDRGVPLGGRKGCSVHLRAVAAALMRAGHSVEAVVAEDRPAAGYRALAEAGLRLRRIRPPVDAREIERRLIEASPELVIERLALLSPHGAEAAARLGLKHLYEVNAPLDQEAADHRGFQELAEARRAFRRGFELSVGAVAVSEEVGEWIRGVAPPGFPVAVVPNGAGPEFFLPPRAEAVERAREGLGLLPGPFHVGFTGSFKPWHDLETLVEAVADLSTRVPSRLVLIGDGPRRDAVLSAARERGVSFAFAAHVPHEEIPALLALCDAIVVPYARTEAYFSPLKLVEAMSAGKPVIASATGPCARLLRHGQDGLLVPPGNRRALAGALESLALDPALRETLGTEARRTAAERYTWEHGVERILSFASTLGARVASTGVQAQALQPTSGRAPWAAARRAS